ncbi:AMP-binding enzyme family protein [Mycobacterium ulcerans str. Harvey]|uniref:AMP-binding enzyme family protein n=1 Tax=Mycobacterium ulcerans str. Harvey TaxID=1299332 RepID=A0ABN0QPK1_MYCUL|nr:AMP-binding enzyme family protein [Mycobacterium ulcerans str. Harvey]
MDLGPWLVTRDVTVVSTVPSLAALWPAEALEAVRLLIFGGEACPPELAERLAVDGRELWNTYGPTEATVVACAARLDRTGPISIGLPLPGWDLAVVDANGQPVGYGEVGELVIGGVGLARYLDSDKDAEKYASMPSLDWTRAYRSGDLVRLERDGLYFCGRGDDQVKVGGRRIELGEVDSALVHLAGVSGGAAAVRRTATGTPVLVGYAVSADPAFDIAAARRQLAEHLPAALVPRLVQIDELPTRTSGKVDRDALPWPPPGSSDTEETPDLAGTTGWLAGMWRDLLGAAISGPEADFFALGGGSLAAAQLVAMLRHQYPQVTVADLYDHPRLGSLAGFLDELGPPPQVDERVVGPTPRLTQLIQTAAAIPLTTLAALPWVTWLAVGNNIAHDLHLVPWTVSVNWWLIVVAFVAFVTPLGRMGIAVLCARILLRKVTPGSYPRGGSVHLRVWCAERLAEASGPKTWPGPVAGLLRPRAGRRHRQGRRPAGDAAGHRSTDGGAPQRDRARGGPVRTLDRRRPVSRRRHHDRQRRNDRVANHAVARRGGRQERRCGTRLRGDRQDQERPVLEGVTRGQIGPGQSPVAGPATAAPRAVGGRVRVDLAAACRSAAAGRGHRPCGDRGGDPAHPQPVPSGAAGAVVDPGRDAGRHRRLRAGDGAGGARDVDRAARGLPPGTQPDGLATVDDRAADGRCPQLSVPAVCQPADADLVADTGRQGGPRHRDLHRPGDPQVHRDRGWRVPGRRHHGRRIRTGRRLDICRADDGGPAGVLGQFGHHPTGPARPRRRAGGGAVGYAAQGQTRLLLVGQPANEVAAQARRSRCRDHL